MTLTDRQRERMVTKLTRTQRSILSAIGTGLLVNGDEGRPQWWIEGGDAVHASAAQALSRKGLLTLVRHDGGQPGVDSFRLSELALSILAEKD